MLEHADLLGRAVRIRTVQCLRLIQHSHFRAAAAHRTDVRHIAVTATKSCVPRNARHSVHHGRIAASCVVLGNLRNNHIGLVDIDGIADAKRQFLNDTYVVNARPLYGRSLELHRCKDGYRIQKARAGRAPLDG